MNLSIFIMLGIKQPSFHYYFISSIFHIKLTPKAVLVQIIAEQVVHAGFVAWNRASDPGDIEVVAIVHIVRDTVLAPCPTSHGKRKRQAIIEVAAVGKGVGLIDDHPAYRHFQSQTLYMRIIMRMYPAGVTLALVVEQAASLVKGRLEVLGSVHGQHR